MLNPDIAAEITDELRRFVDKNSKTPLFWMLTFSPGAVEQPAGRILLSFLRGSRYISIYELMKLTGEDSHVDV